MTHLSGLTLAASTLLCVCSAALTAPDDRVSINTRTDTRTDTQIRSRAAAAAAAPSFARSRTRNPEPRLVHFDPDTGRSLLNYPPHRGANFLHMTLDIVIPDMNTPTFDAIETLDLAPIGWEMDELTLDAKLLIISGVNCPGHDAKFTHDGQHLTISFSPPLAVDTTARVIIAYTLNDPPEGLIWTPESPSWPGRAAQLHTQGEAQSNSYWFACHDFPNVRLTTDLIVDVPQGYLVSSNGRLAERRKAIAANNTCGGVGPREVFHWAQDDKAGGDHVNYLVTLVVGKFDVVDVGTRTLPMPVYVPPGRGTDVRGTYGRTAKMIDTFADRFGTPYPWAKYTQILAWNFGGGMENTSATTLYDTALLEPAALEDHDLEDLLSHELAHQWFGDLITCNSWEHLWLNEGFAEYAMALWYQSTTPPRGGQAAYEALMLHNFDTLVASDTPEAPITPAMVSKAYDDPNDTFERAANPYPKGAAILHMLRQRLGDDVFFKGLRTYVNRFKHKTVETIDFRQTMEEASGENLEQFFYQWCYRPGVPTLEVKTQWLANEKQLRIDVTQTQNIDADNPAFAFTLPVWIADRIGQHSETRLIEVNTTHLTTTLPLDQEPGIIALDPSLAVLAGMKVTQAEPLWLAQLAHAPTYAARVHAARALGSAVTPIAAHALYALANDASATPSLRIEALHALQAGGNSNELEALSRVITAPADVAAGAIESLAACVAALDTPQARPANARAASLLAAAAKGSHSLRIREAAVAGLGKLKATDQLPLIIAAAHSESQSDEIRLAALGAIADMGVPEGLPVALSLTKPGVLPGTRAIAIETVAKLAAADREGAFTALAALVNDREERPRHAAMNALVTLNDSRGEAVLESLSSNARGESDRQHAMKCLRDLRAARANPPSATAQ